MNNTYKNIEPLNDKGQRHGYWEWSYSGVGKLMFKRFYQNDKLVGYSEWSDWNNSDKLSENKYHI